MATILHLLVAMALFSMVTPFRPFNACSMCECTDRERIVNCTGLNLHEGVTVKYPAKMKMLILNNNNFTYLEPNGFANCKELVELKLQSNYIRAVHQDAFKGLSNLKTLKLCSNLIEKLPDNVFTWCSNLTYLSLQYNTISIQSLSSALTVVPSLLNLDITGLPFGYSKDYSLPEGFAHLRQLQVLFLEDVLTHLPASLFHNLENSSLSFLSLSRTRLSNISVDVFLPLHDLHTLELSRTNINVPSAETIFEAINRANLTVSTLNLRHNFIYDESDDYLSAHTFRDLENSSVKILHMEKSWGGFKNHHISNHFFRHLPDLRELYLDNSRINDIHPQAFKDLHQLQTLSLSGNYMNCYDGCRFLVEQHFRHLLHLDMSNNVISDQADNLIFNQESFPQLQSLNLRNNKLASVEKDIFGSLHHLHRLDLSDNPIEYIEAESFSQLHHLQYLRITDCPRLVALPSGTFRGLRSLRTLVLNDNNIASLGRRAFDGLSHLESLSIRNNKLGQDHRINFTTFSVQSNQLTFVDLGENSLENFPFHLVVNQQHIQSLYLDHNRIRALDPGMLSTIGSIHLLDLSYNDIVYIDPSLFESREFLDLNTLSLAGNPLMCDCSMKPFLEWVIASTKTGQLHITSEENHICQGPPNQQGEQFFKYQPTDWECHVRLYVIPILSLAATVFVTCAIVCACKRRSRDHDDAGMDEFTEQDLDANDHETGSLTRQANGHSTPVAEGQTSSSVESSQSSIAGLCVPLRSFRMKKQDLDRETNGHVLLESDDSEPEDTIVEDAVV